MKPSPSRRPPTGLVDFIRLGPDAALDWMRAGGRRDLGLLEQAHIVLVLMRPRPCLVGLLAYALGAAFAGADLSLRVALSALLCYCSGLLANLENAYTDLEEDYRNLPGRVFLLTGIGLPRFRVLLVSFNLIMLMLAASLDRYCFAFMCVGLLLVHQYSFRPLRAKSRPVVGILVFSSITIYTFSVGALAEPGAPFLHAIIDYLTRSSGSPPVDGVPRFLAMAVFLFLWFAANALFKNIADFSGDQEVKLRTSATVFSSPRRAAVACLCLSVASYGSLVVPVFAGLERPTVLWAMVWCIPVFAVTAILVLVADSPIKANRCLRINNWISSGFLATVLLLAAPGSLTFTATFVTFLILVLTEWLAIDSRRDADLSAQAQENLDFSPVESLASSVGPAHRQS